MSDVKYMGEPYQDNGLASMVQSTIYKVHKLTAENKNQIEESKLNLQYHI